MDEEGTCFMVVLNFVIVDWALVDLVSCGLGRLSKRPETDDWIRPSIYNCSINYSESLSFFISGISESITLPRNIVASAHQID